MSVCNVSPIRYKLVDQCSPRRSERKRSLFPSNSPQTKDGIGRFSPLHSSSPDVFSPPLPSPTSSITPIKEEANRDVYLSPISKIKFDNLLKRKSQLEFHSLSPEPLITKSPKKSQKVLEKDFSKVFKNFPESPEKQDQNIYPISSKCEVIHDKLNKINHHTPRKNVNSSFAVRRSPRFGSEEKQMVIKPRTFYGKIAPILAVNQTNCVHGVKRVFPPLPIPKARTRLFKDDSEKKSKKRSRSTSSESLHREKRRKEIYPGVHHAVKRPKPKIEAKHVALEKPDSLRDKIKKCFDFSHTPYAVKKKRSDGWDYPAKFSKPERIEGDDNQNRKFFKGTLPRQSVSSTSRKEPLLIQSQTAKKRKLLDMRHEYFDDISSQSFKKNSKIVNPSDILDTIDDDFMKDAENGEQKNVEELLLRLEDEEEEEDSVQRTKRELVEMFDEDSYEEMLEKSTKMSPESFNKLVDSTAILAINENARDFIPSFGPLIDTKENLESPQRFFPIFSNNGTPSPKLTDITNKKNLKEKTVWRPLSENQMQIDAGQRQFGATLCSECGLVYQLGEPDDEIQHNLYHSNFQTLRHTGWKNEHIVGHYDNDRIIMVTTTDLKSWQSKAENVLKIVDKDLGFTVDKPLTASNFKRQIIEFPRYLRESNYIDRQVDFRFWEKADSVLVKSKTGNVNHYQTLRKQTEKLTSFEGSTYYIHKQVAVMAQRKYLYYKTPRRSRCRAYYPFKADLPNECRMRNFMYGCILSKEDFAFSVPSPDGKRFAQNYMGRADYYVYCNI